jgi:hypothetical protein
MLNGLYRGAEIFRHTDPRVPGWIGFDAAEHLISATLVKAGNLKCDGKQDGRAAPTPQCFVFGRPHDPAADAMRSQALRQEERSMNRRPIEVGPSNPPITS